MTSSSTLSSPAVEPASVLVVGASSTGIQLAAEIGGPGAT